MSTHQSSSDNACPATQDTETDPQEVVDKGNPDPKMQQYANIPSSLPQGTRRYGSSSKSKQISDDWSHVTDPEERRRIQNRVAQRKFRSKAREQKEKNDRDSRNVEYAGSSYQVPGADDLGRKESGVAPSGLPWGGVNMHYVVRRGHDDSGSGGRGDVDTSTHQRGGSTTGNYTYGSGAQYLDTKSHPSTGSYTYATYGSWEGNDENTEGDDTLYYEGTPYYYDYQVSLSH